MNTILYKNSMKIGDDLHLLQVKLSKKCYSAFNHINICYRIRLGYMLTDVHSIESMFIPFGLRYEPRWCYYAQKDWSVSIRMFQDFVCLRF